MNTVLTHQLSRMSRLAWSVAMIFIAIAVLPMATLRAEETDAEASRIARRDAAMQRGMLAVDAQSWTLAAQYFEQARKADPGSPEVLKNLALATDHMGGRELPTLAWFQAFLATEPDAPTAATVRQRILALEVDVEAKLFALFQTAEETARMIADADEKSARIKDIARMQAELKRIVGQVEGSEDGQKPGQTASMKAENIGEWTRRAHYWREKQVIVNFDGFLRGQQGRSPAEATKVLVEAAGELKFAVFLAWYAPREYLLNSIGMKLKLIPAGEFMMGSPDSEKSRSSDEGPVHRVKITKPFYLGVYEVTQTQYEQVMGKNPSFFSNTGRGKEKVTGRDTDQFPVESVSWDDAMEFCRKLSAREGKTYCLPTEAQWEYACRAGTTTSFHFGSMLNGREANSDGSYPYGTETKGPYLKCTTTVGSYSANAFGLYDMHGNVREWCADWHDFDYYEKSPSTDPAGPSSGDDRVLRGGGWFGFAWRCRSANRFRDTPADRFDYLGFRVALAPSE